MNLSALFIRRPIGTILLTIGIIIGGFIAFGTLPVAPLPNIDFPVIFVQANLPGASPATMASSVAGPLERHLQTIAGVNEITSQSTLGQSQIVMQFDLTRNIDGAARDVQAAINAARADLPSTLKTNPQYKKANPSAAPVLILALTSEGRTPSQIYDTVSNIVTQRISQIDGVGDVELGGASPPGTRIDVNPLAAARYGLSLEEIRTAITATSANRPKGVIDAGGSAYQIYGNGAATSSADYRNLVVAWRNGASVRLSDVAHVYDGPEDARNVGIFNGKKAVMVLIFRQPGANIIQTVDAVKAQLPALQAAIPADIHVNIANDRTKTIRASLHDVEVSLLFATLLVVLVVSVFLRSWGATLIPGIAVVVSLAGTLGIMALLGFSLNNFSLMALTVATGFVVDDAIVVLENITRHVEQGMRPFEAAMKGAREVGFTVVSITLSLIAVFIPILFAGGIQGKLFTEFAVTITVAVLISLAISLTTTPMLTSLLLRPTVGAGAKPAGRFARWAEAGFVFFQRRYVKSLDWALGNKASMLVVLAGCVLLTGVIITFVPKGFFPEQDAGAMNAGIKTDQSLSFDATAAKLTQIVGIVKRDGAVQNVVAFVGGRRSGGFMFVILKPLHERPPIRQVIARLRPQMAKVTGVSVFLNPVQDLQGGARGGNALYQYTLKADDADVLKAAATKLTSALKHSAMVTDVDLDQNDSASEVFVHINHDQASKFGLSNTTIDNILYDGFGQRQVAIIYSGINQYHVVLGVDPKFATDPNAFSSVYLPAGGTTITTAVNQAATAKAPLSTVANWQTGSAASEVNHQDATPSATISFNLAGTTSLGTAATEIERVQASLGFPASVRGGFAGTAKQLGQSNASLPFLISAALLVIYIVLGILYENLIHPITVLSTLPSAAMGGALALLVSGAQFDTIAIIGLLLLIGIVKKNAIMIIDFALVGERERGLTPQQAIREAALLRFRPILMTTLAAGFGALPLAIGFGEGSELRRPLGIVIIGGLIASQMISLLTTPVVYLLMDRLRRRKGPRFPKTSPQPAPQTGPLTT